MSHAAIEFEVTGDISPNGNGIDVKFDYDYYLVDLAKKLGGGRFIPPEKGGPLWRFSRDVSVGKYFRKHLGDQFVVSPALKLWAMRERTVATKLRTLAHGETAALTRLPRLCPELYEAMHLGPIGLTYDDETRAAKLLEDGSFQTADIAFLAACEHPINSNQPGLGKTLELIGSVFEAGLEDGPKLIIAPKTSLEVVWVDELLKWQWQDVILCSGSKRQREEAIAAAEQYVKDEEPFWMVMNPATVQYQAVWEETPEGKRTGKKKMWLKHPILHKIKWKVVVLDEFQQFGLGNSDSLTARGVYDLQRERGFGLSGTPVRGKPVKLFGILKFVDPENFTSKWKFAERWLIISQGRKGTTIGDVRREVEEDFWDFIGKYMLRRTKAECIPWLPPKQFVDIWATMEGKQKKQYDIFAQEAEMKIEELNLSATSILAEYTRLKQFAIAAQRVEALRDPPYVKPFPTDDSCKLPHLEEILKERGIISSGKDDDEDTTVIATEAQVVIFSQFTVVVDWLEKYLQNKGVRTTKITGAVTGKNRAKAQRAFQSKAEDRPQDILMNTTAGGVAITLDNADTVVFMDETWVPDDQEQASDRVHRASRIHQVTIYTIRTKGTIEEYIMRRTQGKQNVNDRILDLRREGLRANEAGATETEEDEDE